MLRKLFAILLIAMPTLALIATTGCEQEVKTVQKTERVEESEPQMQDPDERTMVVE